MTPEAGRDGPPRALLIAALAVGVAALIVVISIAAIHQRDDQQGPVAIAAVPAPRADSTECQALIANLPDQLGDYTRAPTLAPTPDGTAAWQNESGTVIIRCGLERPTDFVVGAPLQAVDAVQWFRVAEQDRTTWFVVDRPVYVALTLPQGSGPTPIQLISGAVAAAMPTTPIEPGPPR
jgi:hypothetical protein